MSRKRTAAVERALFILGNRPPLDPAEVLDLTDRLKEELKFEYARKVLALARHATPRTDALWIRLGQQQAVCTYKDINLRTGARLTRALEVLAEVDDPDGPAPQQETLGIAGAIWKRRWDADARKQHLERSLSYYLRGVSQGVEGDAGYTAINAAFVLDLLAAEEERLPDHDHGAFAAPGRADRRARARDLREHALKVLYGLLERQEDLTREWWFVATLAEAHFGLGDYSVAREILERGLAEATPAEWQRESTTRQLAMLARSQAGAGPADRLVGTPAWSIIGRLVGSDGAGVLGIFMGKVGLALSGGGFRASLYHIGVLARLAELDLLRHVEVISCVSGGSIVGAHYYLKLKALLEERADADIGPDDYVRLVRDLERDFLAGVQRNLRTRLFAEFRTNLRMLRSGFSRTRRLGELYESEIYSRTNGTGEVTESRRWLMRDLIIEPAGEENFHPLHHNWRRAAKVPVLVLNATTLNTGHGWQFTASWMGEPPEAGGEIDGNYRLRRLYYDEAPAPYSTSRPIRLGDAVAASAAVPGLFDPLVLPSLYAHGNDAGEPGEPITVRLVDGGVFDNQGAASLIDQECTVQLVSDASGQIEAVDQPKGGTFAVLTRSASVQGARVRTAEYMDLAARHRGGVLRDLMFVHLRQDLERENIDWITCTEPYAKFGEPVLDPPDPLVTPYDINREAQAYLAGLRTDLDSFSDAEAFALMSSGYRTSRHELERCGPALAVAPAREESWTFQAIDPALDAGTVDTPEAARLHRILAVGAHRAFKIWRLDRRLLALAVVVGLALLVAAGGWAFANRALPVRLPDFTVGGIALTVLLLVLAAAGGGLLKRVSVRIRAAIRNRSRAYQILFSIVLALGGSLIARLHLVVFDRWYLRWGAIDRLRAGSRPVAGRPAGERAARPPVGSRPE